MPHDILKLLKQDDSSSQISRSLPRQDTSDTEHTVDLNIFNDEMRLRNNIENMYKKGKIKCYSFQASRGRAEMFVLIKNVS